MEAFFHSILGGGAPVPAGTGAPPRSPFVYPGQRRQQQYQEQQRQQQQQRPPPVASKQAIRRLPIVLVRPEDLVDESNRECCVCLEENKLGDRVIRLPCAHLYHRRCITEWLTTKSCTCPICRYELPTDDPQYERGRIQRMKERKPRYAKYELERMTGKELKELAMRVHVLDDVNSSSLLERRALIDGIVESGKVEIVTAPEPVEHRLSDLKSLGVGALKRTMEDAGVFFDPKDVVEKSDMVKIFVDSGRVMLLPEEEGEEEGVGEEGDGAAVTEEEELEKEALATDGGPNDSEAAMEDAEQTVSDERAADAARSPFRKKARSDDEDMENGSGFDETMETSTGDEGEDQSSCNGASAAAAAPSSSTAREPEPSPSSSFPSDDDRHHHRPQQSPPPQQPAATAPASSSSSAFASRSVSELRALAREWRVDLSDCLEKGEVVDRLAAAAASTTTTSSASGRL